MNRLIVVSNRIPSLNCKGSAGGLTVALTPVLKNTGGVWLGWSGELRDPPSHNRPSNEPVVSDEDGFSHATLDLTPQEFEGFYKQTSNRLLWPLFHGRLDLVDICPDAFRLYRQVNRRFAVALSRLLRPGDAIWVHDYHFLFLASEMRKLGVTNPVGFFCHIPIPPADTLAVLPWHKQLVDSLANYDLVGLQTARDAENLREAVRAHYDGPESAYPRIRNYPISIDTAAFEALAKSRDVARRVRRIADCRRDEIWAMGVERLDYTKGVVERFSALERLFETAPELHGKLSLVQVAAPSREMLPEYSQMETRVAEQAGRINGRFGSFGWVPIRYLHQQFDHVQLAALYRSARVGLVTPLRDGMNLVAKEYVAAQDHRDPGVLVLSKFAGAAAELDAALQVNPFDRQAFAAAVRTAVDMPLDERVARWQAMIGKVRRNDIHRWCGTFLGDLTGPRVSAEEFRGFSAGAVRGLPAVDRPRPSTSTELPRRDSETAIPV